VRFTAETPDWVKAELAEMTQPQDIETIGQIVRAAPELRGPIWQGLSKRKLKHDRGGLGRLWVLAHTVRKGLRPRMGDALLSPKEKLALANRLAYTAKEFAAAIRAVKTAAGGEFPTEIDVGAAVSCMLGAAEPYSERWLTRKSGEDIFPHERQLLYQAFESVELAADAISAGASIWGQKKPLLDKPNHKNADRLWFTRIVTESFVHHFGEPMREEVACLANIWFPDADSCLTANALSETVKVADLPPRTPVRLSKKGTPPN
jgi:hypothetical protein